MNPSSDADATPLEGTPGVGPNPTNRPPSNWREAILLLLAARFSLIELESKEVAADLVRKISYLAAVVICALFAWALLIAGGIALISKVADWRWHWVALAAGGVHALACLIFARGARSTGAPAFPITRAEFKKDREWIENFHPPRTSKH